MIPPGGNKKPQNQHLKHCRPPLPYLVLIRMRLLECYPLERYNTKTIADRKKKGYHTSAERKATVWKVCVFLHEV